MRLYSATQRLPWPTSYVGKILLICFLGTHVPLIALLVWALTATRVQVPIEVFAVVLIATLLGTAMTLYALASMLKPITRSASALQAYTHRKEQPRLPTRFSDEAGQLMSNVQNTLVQLDERLDEISRIATTDTLTGVCNRRWMNDVGIPGFERAQRERETISLLVIDLDEFKSVNDEWGHSIGDQVLIAIADGIREAVRECDQVVRVGGDEFCVFLPGVEGSAVTRIAERVKEEARLAVHALPIDRVVTISIGAATNNANDRTFMDVYRRADRHLYTVKEGGRNAVLADRHAPSRPSSPAGA